MLADATAAPLIPTTSGLSDGSSGHVCATAATPCARAAQGTPQPVGTATRARTEGGSRDGRRLDAYETLPGCRHSYCVRCIAPWRDQHQGNPLGMPCPECRRHSVVV